MQKKRSFEEVYPIRNEYKRFDQRQTAFGKALQKNGRIIEFGNEEFREKRINQNIPGYSLVDYAFSDAAGMYETMPGEHDPQNTGFYKWSSLGVNRKPSKILKWKGSSDEAARIIQKAAKYYGAVKVGFTKRDKRWFYTHSRYGREIVFEDVEEGYTTDKKAVIPESHEYVIALLVPMEYDEILFAPTTLDITSNMGYSRMHILAGHMAEFIRGLGYHATPTGNDTAASIPIAIQAGLGHLGRHGRLITWEYGPLVRIMKIFTDLPLPQSKLAPSGIIEYCEVCKKCSKHCPSQALPMGDRRWKGPTSANNHGVYKWYTKAEKCLSYWNEIGSGCSICFRLCSFTKKEGVLHDLVKWFIRNIPQLNSFFAWTDEKLNYGMMDDPKKYWN